MSRDTAAPTPHEPSLQMPASNKATTLTLPLREALPLPRVGEGWGEDARRAAICLLACISRIGKVGLEPSPELPGGCRCAPTR